MLLVVGNWSLSAETDLTRDCTCEALVAFALNRSMNRSFWAIWRSRFARVFSSDLSRSSL